MDDFLQKEQMRYSSQAHTERSPKNRKHTMSALQTTVELNEKSIIKRKLENPQTLGD